METRSFLGGLLLGTIGAGIGTFMATSGFEVAGGAAVRSGYVFPMRDLINDLDKTLRGGDCELAARKVALLKTRWDALADGAGDPPEGFFEEIVKLRSMAPDQAESPRAPSGEAGSASAPP